MSEKIVIFWREDEQKEAPFSFWALCAEFWPTRCCLCCVHWCVCVCVCRT